MSYRLFLPVLVAAGLQAQTVPNTLNFVGTIQSGPSRVGQRVNFSITLNTLTSANNSGVADPADGYIGWQDEGRTYQYFDSTTQTWETGGNTYGTWGVDQQGNDVFTIDPSLVDRDLFQTISGNLLTGTWVRRGTDDSNGWADPYSNVQVGDAGVRVFVSSDTTPATIDMMFSGSEVLSMELIFGDNPEQVGAVSPAVFSGLQYTMSYYDAFHSIVGQYGQSLASSTSTVVTSAGTYTILFTGLGVNMPAPVPEASTYGLVLGALALAGAAVRRRKA